MKYRIIPVTQFEQNCSLLWCEQSMQAAVVDPGGDIEKILAAVEEEGISLEKNHPDAHAYRSCRCRCRVIKVKTTAH